MVSNHSNPQKTCTTNLTMLRLNSSLKSSQTKFHLFFLQFFLNGLLIMAIHLIRKLLPYPPSTTNFTNTPPCTDFCDPICGDFNECYTFPDVPDSLPPLPPPLPPTTTIVAAPSTSHDGFHLPPLVIIVIIVLASLFLLVSYYTIVIKYCSFWSRLITRRHLTGMSQSDQPPDPHLTEDHPDMVANRFDPVVDHPIWLISTVGLHQSVINSITVVRYKKEDGLIDGTDCSVCLSEFQEGETLRLLPKCKHAFHIDCIDTWLRSHTNCPLCRASIVVSTGIGSNEPSFGHSQRTEFTLAGDSEASDLELGSTQMVNTNNVSESRGETGGNEVDQDQNKIEIDLNSSISILIRSYSMDHRNGIAPYSQQNSSSNSNSNTSSFPIIGSSSSRPQPPPRVRIMKRSYSWSERVFWSARNQNDRNSDILP